MVEFPGHRRGQTGTEKDKFEETFLLSQLADVSSRGASVFEEVETKLHKMWKDHTEAQLDKPVEEVKVYKKTSRT